METTIETPRTKIWPSYTQLRILRLHGVDMETETLYGDKTNFQNTLDQINRAIESRQKEVDGLPEDSTDGWAKYCLDSLKTIRDTVTSTISALEVQETTLAKIEAEKLQVSEARERARLNLWGEEHEDISNEAKLSAIRINGGVTYDFMEASQDVKEAIKPVVEDLLTRVRDTLTRAAVERAEVVEQSKILGCHSCHVQDNVDTVEYKAIEEIVGKTLVLDLRREIRHALEHFFLETSSPHHESGEDE